MNESRIDVFIKNIQNLDELTKTIDNILKKIQKEFAENEIKMHYSNENNSFFQIRIFKNNDPNIPYKKFNFNYMCYLNKMYDTKVDVEYIKNEFYDLVNKQFGFE